MNKLQKMTAIALTAAFTFSGFGSMGMNTADAAEAEIVQGVNFRTAPATSSSKIRLLKAGETVDVVEQVNSYWYKVKDRSGKVGYVSALSKYIQYNDSTVSANQAKIVRGVNFRTSPSTDASKIRMLQTGERVQVIDEVNNYWIKIKDSNGKIGYVSSSSKYIQYTAGSSNQASTSAGTSVSNTNVSSVIKEVIASGKKYLGTPYEFGSSRYNTSTFDCSDFVRQAFKEGAGITLPSDSRKQADYVKDKGNAVYNWENLKPGDLMFFMSYKGTSKSKYTGLNKSKQRITHVGIYLGDGKILHTYSKDSGGVRIDNIDGRHWEYRFVFGGSAL
ncbi:SH3 domain-containing protein [Marinicrinis lubricantis]|uniref:SH3 domain-containing protein n=1 Tax=Marinicrinis lubricantis TaxID=2086470 RepID=A0ABW1IUT9_9BACL